MNTSVAREVARIVRAMQAGQPFAISAGSAEERASIKEGVEAATGASLELHGSNPECLYQASLADPQSTGAAQVVYRLAGRSGVEPNSLGPWAFLGGGTFDSGIASLADSTLTRDVLAIIHLAGGARIGTRYQFCGIEYAEGALADYAQRRALTSQTRLDPQLFERMIQFGLELHRALCHGDFPTLGDRLDINDDQMTAIANQIAGVLERSPGLGEADERRVTASMMFWKTVGPLLTKKERDLAWGLLERTFDLEPLPKK